MKKPSLATIIESSPGVDINDILDGWNSNKELLRKQFSESLGDRARLFLDQFREDRLENID